MLKNNLVRPAPPALHSKFFIVSKKNFCFVQNKRIHMCQLKDANKIRTFLQAFKHFYSFFQSFVRFYFHILRFHHYDQLDF
mgnify:CR=1 FL=1